MTACDSSVLRANPKKTETQSAPHVVMSKTYQHKLFRSDVIRACSKMKVAKKQNTRHGSLLVCHRLGTTILGKLCRVRRNM